MKMMVRPSAWAFFNGWPVHASPVADRFFSPLASSSYGALAAPAQIVQNFPDMPGMIRDAELVLDQVGHPGASP
jgi:hypothetical protein